MGLRRYTDKTGREWNVWDVPPRFSVKRSGIDRRSRSVQGYAPERRRSGERRVTEAPAEWLHGWITFQNAEEKWRLCPLPEDWEAVPDDQLEAYRNRGIPVNRA